MEHAEVKRLRGRKWCLVFVCGARVRAGSRSRHTSGVQARAEVRSPWSLASSCRCLIAHTDGGHDVMCRKGVFPVRSPPRYFTRVRLHSVATHTRSNVVNHHVARRYRVSRTRRLLIFSQSTMNLKALNFPTRFCTIWNQRNRESTNPRLN